MYFQKQALVSIHSDGAFPSTLRMKRRMTSPVHRFLFLLASNSGSSDILIRRLHRQSRTCADHISSLRSGAQTVSLLLLGIRSGEGWMRRSENGGEN